MTLTPAIRDIRSLIAEVRRLQSELQKTHESAFVYFQENKSLKEQRQELWEENDLLRDEKKVMTKALEFYADENGYVTEVAGMEIKPTVMIDKGEWARKVLDQVKGEGA